MFDWNDLRSFLAVAETGSTLAAGRALKVSQTTAARRVAALEQALGVTLFDRRQAGYALTAAGESLLQQARAVEAAAGAFADAAASQSRDLRGTVRLTTLEIYAVTILTPILRDLHEAYPEIRIELDTSEEVRDLGSGQADVALRGSKAPTGGGGLVGRRIVADPWTLYCSRGYAASHPRPRTRDELRKHVFIGGGGSVWPRYQAWLRQYDLEEAVAMHHGSAIGLLAAIRDGFGLAVLPSFVADRDPDLVRCLDPVADDTHGLWLMTHERLRHMPRVRAVLDFLADRLTGMAREESRQPPAAWLAA
ncbi:LysR family transcriptional regulator [Sphingosinicella rhizophila]|uniref:LysR family transcriptional regulator n=1 Tax=Sphingosinicella rhizophila TaxID=3050082 RepID=A0ABU3Q599_9SPHN|nr:LysR family transcriptional regulator [Sphingosinicella sp. GR2756]MDT9598582.1 LysR family transcriptional regulator [Sphingosinicella sp. GR2756]